MSQVAQASGIGRATLYRYFSGVEPILLAWHEQQIARHLVHLVNVRDAGGHPVERLEAVMGAFALISHESHGIHDSETTAMLHRDAQLGAARRQVRHLLRDLLAEGATAGVVRSDVPPDELASYAINALQAAGSASSKAAVRRLVAVTRDALRPPT